MAADPDHGDGVAVGELQRRAEGPGVEGEHRQRAGERAGGVGARAAQPAAAGEGVEEQHHADEAGLELERHREAGEQAAAGDQRGARRPRRSRISTQKAANASVVEIACEKNSAAKTIMIVQAERDRRRGAVAGLEPVGDPAHHQQQQHRRDHRGEQGQHPDHRRRVLDPLLDPLGPPRS